MLLEGWWTLAGFAGASMVVELRGVVRIAYRADRDGPWRNLTLPSSGAVLQQRARLRRARLHQ